MATICPFINSCKKRAVLAALLALIVAIPAWAKVDITYAQIGDPCDYRFMISYDATTETNLIRAFSLDIRLDNDANIVEVTALNPDYYIFPGTIQIDAFGNVIDYGTALAEYDDLPSDTLPGLDSNGITIEMASLYAPVGPGSPNAPPRSGDLVSIFVSKSTCITITPNVARAGSTGVVMEDPDEIAEVNFPEPFCIGFWHPYPCYVSQPDYDQWLLLGEPECWCYPRQCHGDADGMMHGTPIGGYYWVGIPDLNILVSAWMVKEPPKGAGIESVPNGICADFDHAQHGTPIGGYYRVGIPDLNLLVASWMVKEPPKGPGVPPDCLNLP